MPLQVRIGTHCRVTPPTATAAMRVAAFAEQVVDGLVDRVALVRLALR
jgi:hypothetical protein